MSELIQEEKYISYENFIPNWTELVKEMDDLSLTDYGERMDYTREKGYNFTNGSQCLVGEGHKGNIGYAIQYMGNNHKYCDECRDLSFRSASDAVRGGELFDTFKRTFYDHMIDTHPDLMVKRN